MSRRRFIERYGAQCKNWSWSWAFVNHKEKFVIFGAWDTLAQGDTVTILHEDWKSSPKTGHAQPGYSEALEYLDLVQNGGYALRIFRMYHKSVDPDDPNSISKIAGFVENLTNATLVKDKMAWLAIETIEEVLLPGESSMPPIVPGKEGKRTLIAVDKIERSGKARASCIAHHGTSCFVCKFDFERKYGDLGRGFIEVHHLKPLSDSEGEHEVDPINDLVPVCPNCHRMLHRGDRLLAPDELRKLIRCGGRSREQ